MQTDISTDTHINRQMTAAVVDISMEEEIHAPQVNSSTLVACTYFLTNQTTTLDRCWFNLPRR